MIGVFDSAFGPALATARRARAAGIAAMETHKRMLVEVPVECRAVGFGQCLPGAADHATRSRSQILKVVRSEATMPIAEAEAGQRQRLDHGERLRPDEHLAAVKAVDPDTGNGSEDKGGNLTGEGHGAEQEGGAGEPVDEPTGGHPRHPSAD